MLLDEFRNENKYKSVILSEQSPSEEEEEEKEGPEDESEEFQPIKKYQLIQKLYNLKQTLLDNGVHNSDLNVLIKFSNELSYETLLKLTDGIIDSIQKQADQRGQDNVKKREQ